MEEAAAAAEVDQGDEKDDDENDDEDERLAPCGFLRQLIEWKSWDISNGRFVFMDCMLNDHMPPYKADTKVDIVGYDPRNNVLTIIPDSAEPKATDYTLVAAAVPVEEMECGEAAEEEM